MEFPFHSVNPLGECLMFHISYKRLLWSVVSTVRVYSEPLKKRLMQCFLQTLYSSNTDSLSAGGLWVVSMFHYMLEWLIWSLYTLCHWDSVHVTEISLLLTKMHGSNMLWYFWVLYNSKSSCAGNFREFREYRAISRNFPAREYLLLVPSYQSLLSQNSRNFPVAKLPISCSVRFSCRSLPNGLDLQNNSQSYTLLNEKKLLECGRVMIVSYLLGTDKIIDF